MFSISLLTPHASYPACGRIDDPAEMAERYAQSQGLTLVSASPTIRVYQDNEGGTYRLTFTALA